MIAGITKNIAWYFFLAGAGSGAFVLFALLDSLFPEKQPRLSATSPATSPIIEPALSVCLVLAGSLFLLADLGAPELFPLAFANFGRSVISFGILSISLFVAFAVAHTAALVKEKTRTGAALAPLFKWAAFAAALTTASYTGYYLYSMTSVAFWRSPLVILLFFTSSLSTGSATLMLAAFLQHPMRRMARLKTLCEIDSRIIVAEAATLAAFVVLKLFEGGSAAALALEMVSGGHAPLFWVCSVGFGILLPAILERVFVKGAGNETYAIAIAIFLLFGGFALRCSIILA